MDRSYIPITRFYENCLPAARRNGYKYVMCLLARDRGIDGLYSALKQDWDALDDITGKDFLFMFTGKYSEEDRDYCSGIMGRNCLLCNEYFHVLNQDPQGVESTYDFRSREERAKFTLDLPREHTRAIAELRDLFGISEREIPCLVYTNLHNEKVITVPFKRNDIYDYFRKLYISLENVLHEINTLTNEFAKYGVELNPKEHSTLKAISALREELLEIAESLDEDEKNSLIDCVLRKSYGKFQQNIRSKLNRYVDLSKNTIVPIDEKITEPKQVQQCLSDLYDQADELIRQSTCFANEYSSNSVSPAVDMHQNGSGSVQIGVVAEGGTVNVVDTDWNVLIIRKAFDILENFMVFLAPYDDVDFDDRNNYRLPNEISGLLDFFKRHSDDLIKLMQFVDRLNEITAKYKSAAHVFVYKWWRSLEEYSETQRSEIEADKQKASAVISCCVADYKVTIAEMLRLICNESNDRRSL